VMYEAWVAQIAMGKRQALSSVAGDSGVGEAYT